MKYENLIIGSGLFGLSIARELLNKGEKVCIIDRHSDPNESSVNALGRIDPTYLPYKRQGFDFLRHSPGERSKPVF